MKLRINQTENPIVLNVTPTSVAIDLVSVMKNHIGAQNKIHKDDLLQYVFKVDPNILTELQFFVLNKALTNALSKLRIRTKCFIVREYERGEGSYYYVIENKQELNRYLWTQDTMISRHKWLKERAEKAVSEKWYKHEWQLN